MEISELTNSEIEYEVRHWIQIVKPTDYLFNEMTEYCGSKRVVRIMKQRTDSSNQKYGPRIYNRLFKNEFANPKIHYGLNTVKCQPFYDNEFLDTLYSELNVYKVGLYNDDTTPKLFSETYFYLNYKDFFDLLFNECFDILEENDFIPFKLATRYLNIEDSEIEKYQQRIKANNYRL